MIGFHLIFSRITEEPIYPYIFFITGDHYYKRNQDLDAKDQMITALPDIETMLLEEGDEFMVIACDGIWLVMILIRSWWAGHFS